MTAPMKSPVGPWNQGLYEISATAKEVVGTLRMDLYGNKYRYAKAGATALARNKQTIAASANADWMNKVCAADVEVGSKTVTLTITDVGADVLPENYFQGGQLQVQDGAGEGQWYRILYSTALTNGGTTATVTLEEGIRVALTTASECSLVPSPWMGTVLSATITTPFPTGVPLVAVTANYYYWSLTGGLGLYLGHTDVAAVGTMLVLGTEDGALVPKVLNLDGSVDADETLSVVAIAYGTAGVSGEYCPCWYVID